MKTTFISAAVIMLFAAGAARAQEGARPCKADIEKFCKDVKPGEGRIIACLKEHEAELSADCKVKDMALKGGKERKGGEGKGEQAWKGEGRGMGPLGEACKADFEKFCKDAGHEKMGCMKEHQKDLSEGCKTQMAKSREGFMKQHPCAADMEKLCAGMKPGDGKFAACMREHEKDLSEACKTDFAKRKEEMQKTNPCAADMEKFCKDVKPGEGRIIACLKTHEAELSGTCKARQAEAKERRGKNGERGEKGEGRGMGRGKPGDNAGDKPEPGSDKGQAGPADGTGSAGGDNTPPPDGSAGN